MSEEDNQVEGQEEEKSAQDPKERPEEKPVGVKEEVETVTDVSIPSTPEQSDMMQGLKKTHSIAELNDDKSGMEVVITGKVHEVRNSGGHAFIVLIEDNDLIQVVLIKEQNDFFQEFVEVPLGSEVAVKGTVQETKGARRAMLEVFPSEFEIISRYGKSKLDIKAISKMVESKIDYATFLGWSDVVEVGQLHYDEGVSLLEQDDKLGAQYCFSRAMEEMKELVTGREIKTDEELQNAEAFEEEKKDKSMLEDVQRFLDNELENIMGVLEALPLLVQVSDTVLEPLFASLGPMVDKYLLEKISPFYAKFQFKYFSDLKAAGFTQEQAFSLMMNNQNDALVKSLASLPTSLPAAVNKFGKE